MIKYLEAPFTNLKDIADLRVGDVVYLNGQLLTMRDSAHNRLFKAKDEGEMIEAQLKNGAVWHCGPVVSKEGETWKITSAGSTTSYRFTAVTPRLLDEFGVKALVGKGGLGPEAVSAMIRNGAVFMATVGGCAGVYAKNVLRVNNLYWPELGLPEAVWDIEVKNLGALVVAIDSLGNNLYGKTMGELAQKLPQLYEDLKIKPEKKYVYWPPSIPGIPAVQKCLEDYNVTE